MAHSYSSISKFITCPRQYYHQYILKDVVFEQNEAAKYGSEMHDAMDKLIQGKMDFTPRYQFLEPVVTAVKSIPGEIKTEYPLAFKEDWTATTWTDRNSFIKGKSDCTIFHPEKPWVILKDWKFSGKVDCKNFALEMDMFALLHFKRYERLERVNAGLVWLKARGPESKFNYTRKEDMNKLEDTIMGHIARIDEAVCFENFPAKISGLCYGWCSAKNCEHWKPKKEKC